jgi:hypothetical protein
MLTVVRRKILGHAPSLLSVGITSTSVIGYRYIVRYTSGAAGIVVKSTFNIVGRDEARQ